MLDSNAITYQGHPFLWIFAGMENDLVKDKLPEIITTNKYLVEAEKIFLGNNFTNVKFMKKVNRLYFTKLTHSKTIFSNNFPDADLERSPETKGIVKSARINFTHNDFDKYEFQNHRVKQLVATKFNLFAVLQDNEGALFVQRININAQFGFSYPDFQRFQLDCGVAIGEQFEFIGFDLSLYETELMLLCKETGKLYSGRFFHNKKSNIKLSPALSEEVGFSISLCIVNASKIANGRKSEQPSNEIILVVLDNNPNELKLFRVNTNNKGPRYKFEKSLKIEAKNYLKIEYFYTQSKVLMNFRKDEIVHFIVLFTDNEVSVYNIDIERQFPLIGQGKASIDSYLDDSFFLADLNYFQVSPIEQSYTISDTGIFFGSQKQMYGILTSRARNIYFNQSDYKFNDYYNAGDS